MSKKTVFVKDIHRIIDANTNRLKEGLRVIEDIIRFIANDKKLTYGFKNLRHGITSCLAEVTELKSISIIKDREAEKDVGKHSIRQEFKRNSVLDIFLANAQRIKESIRVLEEFFKLYDKKTAAHFKSLRYKMYVLEKRAIKKLISLKKS